MSSVIPYISLLSDPNVQCKQHLQNPKPTFWAGIICLTPH